MWFNYWGLIIFVIMMIPNVIYANANKDGFKNVYKNKIILIAEQIGRYGSMVFMVFNIPYLSIGFWFKDAFAIYLAVNGSLLLFYCVTWAVLFNKNSMFKSLSLSLAPSLIFIFSGVMFLNVPLIILSVTFGICHITLCLKNVILSNKEIRE